MRIVRTKVWNEHVKMLATLFNAVAIGIIGVAVIGPIAQPDNPFYGWGGAASDKLSGLTEISPVSVIEWPAILGALLVHGLAHVILRAQVDDD